MNEQLQNTANKAIAFAIAIPVIVAIVFVVKVFNAATGCGDLPQSANYIVDCPRLIYRNVSLSIRLDKMKKEDAARREAEMNSPEHKAWKAKVAAEMESYRVRARALGVDVPENAGVMTTYNALADKARSAGVPVVKDDNIKTLVEKLEAKGGK